MKDLLSHIATCLIIFGLIMLGGVLQDLMHVSECKKNGLTNTYVWNLKLSCSVIKDK